MLKGPVEKATTDKALAAALKALVEAKRSVVVEAIDDAKRSVNLGLTQATDEIKAVKSIIIRALDDCVNDYKNVVFSKILAAVETNAPPEAIAAIRAGRRLSSAAGSLAQFRDAIGASDPQKALAAASRIAIDVFGVDLADAALVPWKAELEAFKTGLDGVAAAAGSNVAKLLVAQPFLPISDQAQLQREILACDAYEDGSSTTPRSALAMPPSHASGPAVGALAAAILQLRQAAATDLPKVAAALADPKIEAVVKPIIPAQYDDLKLFQSRLAGLVGKPGIVDNDLHSHLTDCYCDVVRLTAAVASLRAVLKDWTPAADDGFSKLSELTRRMAEDGKRLAEKLGAVAKLLADFLENEPNKTFAAAGMLAGAAGYVGTLSGQSGLEPFASLAKDLKEREKAAVGGIVVVVATALDALRRGLTVMASATKGLMQVAARGAAALKNAGIPLEPEMTGLVEALRDLAEGFKAVEGVRLDITTGNGPKTFDELRRLPVFGGGATAPTFSSYFSLTGSTARDDYAKAVDGMCDVEAKALAAWKAMRQRIEGAPAALRTKIWKAVQDTGALGVVADGYGVLVEMRSKILVSVEGAPLLRQSVREALLVKPVYQNVASCPFDDRKAPPTKLAECDRLIEERKIFSDAQSAAAAPPVELKRVLASWAGAANPDLRAAPLVIADHVRKVSGDVLSGDVLSVIDVAAFRDEIEDALSALIPTKATLAFDFRSVFDKPPNEQAIFQPKLGGTFAVAVRAIVDLMNPSKVDFRAKGEIGAFDIKLVGSLIEALKLKFAGAAFEIVGGAKPRFDVMYLDFEIGPALEFAQKLQEYLSPKNGGVVIQPLTRTVGIEAGYGLNLGTISLVGVSFFNVSLNVTAELPFSEQDALFKVSLGRRLSPFTMSILPFAGAGYFSIYAAADGVRGFEASFEYGGGGSIGFGPLTAQCRIMTGVFVRILEVEKGVRTTELYGSFFAGGSASIWIFHFATSLYVRLGSSGGGEMYGEAIYSFSFSLGIVDYDYSVTAWKQEQKLGGGDGGGGGQTTGALEQAMRFAGLDQAADALADAGIELVGHRRKLGRGGKKAAPAKVDVRADAACQAENWDGYISYFDVDLLEACEAL